MSVVVVTGSGNMLRCMLLVRSSTKYNVVVVAAVVAVVPSLLFSIGSLSGLQACNCTILVAYPEHCYGNCG
jgi:hypothetical protein